MIFHCKNLAYKYIVCFFLLTVFPGYARLQWPQIAIPFSYNNNGGFFFNSQNKVRFYENSSSRTVVFPLSVFTVSTGKKIMTLNGKKFISHDITAFGKDLIINGMGEYDSVHLMLDDKNVRGFLLRSTKKFKKYLFHYELETFLRCKSSIEDWHKQEQKLLSDIETAFAVIASQKSLVVRVLLSKVSHEENTEWQFTSHKGFLIHALDTQKRKKIFCDNSVQISLKKGILFCNGKRFDHGIKVESLNGYAECNGIEYDGCFCIMIEKDSFLCVNHVDLEDYIVAVLRTESWPGWPLEVNKAFAIACRSYVASKIIEAQRSGQLFHVKNTNAHQTYRGRHDSALLKQAVAQTKGIILGFNQKPVLAMFDSCCGGVIPAHIEDFDFKKVPYLERTYACTYCKQCSLYSWKISYELPVFEKLIREYNKEINKIHDIHIFKKDKAGLIVEVKLRSQKGPIIISGKQLYSMLKEVKSFHFDICKKAGLITFSGRGFGHHLGLCQWGARQMVREGWDYKSILQFYYPETYFMRMA